MNCLAIQKMNKRYIELFISIFVICFSTLFIKRFYPNSKLVFLFGLIAVILNLLSFFYPRFIGNIIDNLIKNRYIIALIVFVLCLTFNIHGSSIGIFDEIYSSGNEIQNTEIFGDSRWIRSDEYNVQTPYFFSQYYNNFKEISYQMSFSGQDMILGYNAPVKDLTLIGKPFTWGYLLFGNEIGLSWYWCSKIILFLLSAFELCKLITHNDKISLIGCFLVVFSPAMQWWFSPHMYVVFFWATSLIVIGYYFFIHKNVKEKLISTILAPCVLVGFAIALFPSCQVALGLSALVIWSTLLYRDKHLIKWNKCDFIRIVLVVFCIVIVLGNFFINAKEEINLLYGTVYPGQRISTGGDLKLFDLFMDLTTIFTPYFSSNVLNDCEISTFNHLGLFCIILFPYLNKLLKKEGDKNVNIGKALFIIMCVQIIFMLIGFSEWLAKITLFSYINRMKIVYGFIATLFTIWTMNYILKYRRQMDKRIIGLCMVMYSILNIAVLTSSNIEYMQNILITIFSKGTHLYAYLAYLIVIIGILLIIVGIIFKWNKMAINIVMCIIFISGCTVNPVNRGVSSINGNLFAKKINELIKVDDGYWLTIDSLNDQNFILANGGKVLNSVNFYPDYEKWKLIDENLENDEYYNRYAHIKVKFTDEDTYFEYTQVDSIIVNLNYVDLQKWQPRYIVTHEDYEYKFEQYGYSYEKLYIDENGLRIYGMTY